MTYLLQPKPPRRSAGKRAFRAVLIIVCIAFGLSFIAPSALPKVAGVFATPLWTLRTRVVQTVSEWRLFEFRNTILEENKRLSEENEALKIDLLLKQSLANENQELRNLLGRNPVPLGQAAAAILHPSQTHYDIFVVDKPPQVETGFAVRGRIGLGEVEQDLGTSLKIVLYSSPGVTTEGRLMDTGAPISLQGKGGGNFVSVLPRDFDVSIDDFIVLPRDGSFVVAQVRSIDESETDSFKLVRSTVPLNIFNLRWVEIIPNE